LSRVIIECIYRLINDQLEVYN